VKSQDIHLRWGAYSDRDRADADSTRNVEKRIVSAVRTSNVAGVEAGNIEVARRESDLASVGVAGES
jgi:hypothetical protein